MPAPKTKESPKLRKELAAHEYLSSLDKQRGHGWKATFKEGVMVMPGSSFFGCSPTRLADAAVPQTGENHYLHAVYANTLDSLKEFLSQGCTTDIDTYLLAYGEAKAAMASKDNERAKQNRAGMQADIPQDLSLEYPLLLSNMIVDSYPLTLGNQLPVIVSHPTFKKLSEMVPDAATWQVQTLAVISKQMEKLARMRAEIIAMDVAGYQEALDGIKAGAARYIEEGPDNRLIKGQE